MSFYPFSLFLVYIECYAEAVSTLSKKPPSLFHSEWAVITADYIMPCIMARKLWLNTRQQVRE